MGKSVGKEKEICQNIQHSPRTFFTKQTIRDQELMLIFLEKMIVNF